MQNNKTFRLFISSTFNDFRGERKVLQESVFPKIKDYCANKGLTFQPIDLRWGVTDEAQLDQKTLDLCLNEVRNCKLHPAPNFLLMLGDRYGWVPLPYHIEKKEFELLCISMSKEEQFKVKEWYQLDENQIPPSYVLQQRKDEYEVYENWEKIERRLRKILQTAVHKTLKDGKFPEELPGSNSDKYFNSAVEEETIEGAFPYLYETKFQKELSKRNKNLSEIDTKGVFVLFRKLGCGLMEKRKVALEPLVNSRLNPPQLSERLKIIKNFYESHKSFESVSDMKEELNQILKGNIFRSTVSIRGNQKLDTRYLRLFTRQVELFLKDRVDCQVESQKKQREEELVRLAERRNVAPPEKLLFVLDEFLAHENYAKQKTKNFIDEDESAKQKTKTVIDQYEILKKIDDYCQNDNQQALVIHGPSGRGKSTILAKAFQNQANPVIRFVGATPNANTIKSILYSIFEELGIEPRALDEIEHDKQKEADSNKTSDSASQDKESFEDFSERMKNKIMQLERVDTQDKNIIIFIDAVDQLTHDDEFIWLPETLPNKVKIIISVLHDKNHSDDSTYYTALIKKTDQLNEVQKFTEKDGLILLNKILSEDKRKLQQHQIDYVTKRYKTSSTPLYIALAAQEVKHWKSYDCVADTSIENQPKERVGVKPQDLQDTQKGIIEEFIQNLTKFYHHSPELVNRVLGYLFASKDGLSESEILTLISQDQTFINNIATDQFHKKESPDLPMAVWARLQMMLKPFLSQKLQDNETLLYFSHREFEDVVKNQNGQRDEHVALIKALQKLIKESQNESFENNRWGKLFCILAVDDFLTQHKTLETHVEFICSLENTSWIFQLLDHLSCKGNQCLDSRQYNFGEATFQLMMAVSKSLFGRFVTDIDNRTIVQNFYHVSLSFLDFTFSHLKGRVKDSISVGLKRLEFLEKTYSKNNSVEEIFNAHLALASSYKDNQDIELASKHYQACKNIRNEYSISNDLEIAYYNNYGYFLLETDDFNSAVKYFELTLKEADDFDKKAGGLLGLAFCFNILIERSNSNQDSYQNATYLEKSLAIYNEFYRLYKIQDLNKTYSSLFVINSLAYVNLLQTLGSKSIQIDMLIEIGEVLNRDYEINHSAWEDTFERWYEYSTDIISNFQPLFSDAPEINKYLNILKTLNIQFLDNVDSISQNIKAYEYKGYLELYKINPEIWEKGLYQCMIELPNFLAVEALDITLLNKMLEVFINGNQKLLTSFDTLTGIQYRLSQLIVYLDKDPKHFENVLQYLNHYALVTELIVNKDSSSKNYFVAAHAWFDFGTYIQSSDKDIAKAAFEKSLTITSSQLKTVESIEQKEAFSQLQQQVKKYLIAIIQEQIRNSDEEIPF